MHASDFVFLVVDEIYVSDWEVEPEEACSASLSLLVAHVTRP